jgi:flagellar motor switch protein FliM
MNEKQTIKPERTPHKKVIKMPPALGDWTTYRPVKPISKKVRAGLYGFDRLSSENLDQAIKIHYQFITKFLYFLKTEIKLTGELYSISGEQSDYLRFLKTSAGAVVQLKISIPGCVDAAILLIDLSLANSIVNYTLGSRDTEMGSRGLTELESEILESVLKKTAPFYAEAFEQAIGIPELSIVSSPEITIDSSVNPANSFLVFNLTVALNDNPPAQISIGYPASLLKTLLGKVNDKPGSKTLNLAKLPPSILNQLNIPIEAMVGGTFLSTSDLQALEVGDVIALDKTLDHAIIVKIGDRLTLLAQPGKSEKKLVARIVGLHADEKVKVQPLPTEPKIKPAAAEATETPEEISAGTVPSFPESPAGPGKPEQTAAESTTPPPPRPTLNEKIKSIDQDFLLEEELKEEYPGGKDELEEVAADEEVTEEEENEGEDELDEDVLGEEENLENLEDSSLDEEDWSLDSFSLKDVGGGPPPKAPEGG